VGGVETVAHREIRVADLGEAIPWAAQLAVVAAVDAVADQRPQGDRNGDPRNSIVRYEMHRRASTS
jgi:hypothetical protein